MGTEGDGAGVRLVPVEVSGVRGFFIAASDALALGEELERFGNAVQETMATVREGVDDAFVRAESAVARAERAERVVEAWLDSEETSAMIMANDTRWDADADERGGWCREEQVARLRELADALEAYARGKEGA